jgi:hypothetical protein
MKRLLNISPTFNPAARTVTFPASLRFSIKRLYAIINLDRDAMIYRIGAAGNMYSSISGNTVTLEFDTTSHNGADILAIIYDDAIDYIPGDDSDTTAISVRALPKRVARIGFTKALTNAIDPDWGTVVITGAGQTYNQINGTLVITCGVTARSETIIRSLASWKGGIRLRARSTLSQRIINQNFFVELVDVIGDGLSYTIASATAITVTIPNNPFNAENVGQNVHLGAFQGTGTFLGGRYPIASVSGNQVTFTVSGFAAGTGTCSLFGWNYYQLVYNGTSGTSVNFQTQRRGYANAAVAAAITSTASPGHIAVVTGNDLQATLYDGVLASATTISLSPRASQQENVPDDATLRLQIRVQNLGTAPASTTTWTIGFVSVSNYATQDVSIQDVQPMFVQGLPVDIVRGNTLAAGTNRIGFVAASGIWYDDSVTPLGASAVFVSTARDLTQTATATIWTNGLTIAQEFVGSAESDQPGTLYIEVSREATPSVWRRVKSVDMALVPGGGYYAEIIHRPSWRHIRMGYGNGVTAQGRFTLNSIIKAI